MEPGVTIALVCAGFLVFVVTAALVREQILTLEASDWARQTVRVEAHIAGVLQRVTEAEAAQRGFVLTGDPTYVEQYERVRESLPDALAQLQKVMAENPEQRGRFEALAPILAAKMEEVRLTIAQRQGGDPGAARETIRMGLGKDYMSRIGGLLGAATAAERQVLRQRLLERRTRASRSAVLAVVGSGMALVLMSGAAAVLTALLRRARAAESALRESEERLRVTLDSIGEAVIATDMNGEIVFMNRVAEALTGWRAPEALGSALEDVFRIVNATTHRRVESPAGRVLRDGVVVGLGNHTRLVTRAGQEISIENSAAPIRDVDGDTKGVVLVFRDVSERESAEAQHRRALWADAARIAAERNADAVATARATAERANEAKDAFLAILSHELRSPLSAMLAWVGILQRRADDPATRARAVAVLERSVRVQTQLINDLLDVSSIVSGKLQLERKPVDLAAELRGLLDGLQPLADAKGVTLGRDISSGPLVVLGDEARLDQVVRNLVENAVKFTPRGGHIGVRLSRGGSEAELRISDTGEGFPAEQRAVIFDRFQQSQTPRTRRHGGLGLGLAIVRHLVEEHGGTVTADSPGSGRGATFTIRFPLSDVLVPLRSSSGRGHELPMDLRGVSVLLVEDDTDWREAVALRLTQAGADVTGAGSVGEALALLDVTRPQVLVSDIGMPEADGYELIRRVRTRPGAPLRAIAMTGFADSDTRNRCLESGFDAFLAKPFEPGRLVSAVGEVLVGKTPG